jgi:RNA polymerase sigma factor (sigma-70 family)
LERLGCGQGDFVLYGEDVLDFPIVGLRPKLKAIVRLDQFAVMRTWLPSRRTLPSKTLAAPSFRPTSRRSSFLPADSIVEPSKDSHDLYVSKLEAEQVRAAIQELPAEFREIILLREYEDLSYQEIASVLGCPVGTVMSRLGRARAKPRPLLAATLKGSDRPERGAKHEGLR